MVKVFYKVVTWRELEFVAGTTVQEIKDVLEKGDVFDCYDMEGYIGEINMVETEELLTPEENDFQPTVEIFEGDVLMYSNWDTETII